MGCELAVEGSTRNPSMALRIDTGHVVSRRVARSSSLLSEAADFLAGHGLGPLHVDLLHVTTGPGAYTSLRVSLAFVQGLALATGVRVRSYNATEVLAATHVQAGGTGNFWIWNDARAGMLVVRPFMAEGGRCRPLAETLCLQSEEAWGLLREPTELVGSAAGLAEVRGHRGTLLEPEAKALFFLEAQESGEAKAPLELSPVYVRQGVGR